MKNITHVKYSPAGNENFIIPVIPVTNPPTSTLVAVTPHITPVIVSPREKGVTVKLAKPITVEKSETLFAVGNNIVSLVLLLNPDTKNTFTQQTGYAIFAIEPNRVNEYVENYYIVPILNFANGLISSMKNPTRHPSHQTEIWKVLSTCITILLSTPCLSSVEKTSLKQEFTSLENPATHALPPTPAL